VAFWSRLLGRPGEGHEPEPPPQAVAQPTVESLRVELPAEPPPEPPPAPEPAAPETAVPEVEPSVRAAAREDAPEPAAEPRGDGPPLDAAELEARLERLLDGLGAAHRRPYARAD
jgi:hypothetical protein